MTAMAELRNFRCLSRAEAVQLFTALAERDGYSAMPENVLWLERLRSGAAELWIYEPRKLPFVHFPPPAEITIEENPHRQIDPSAPGTFLEYGIALPLTLDEVLSRVSNLTNH